MHIHSMTDDYYAYVEASYELVGQMYNRHYKLGQKVRICVVQTDKLNRTIDFELVQRQEG